MNEILKLEKNESVLFSQMGIHSAQGPFPINAHLMFLDTNTEPCSLLAEYEGGSLLAAPGRSNHVSEGLRRM